MKMSMVYTDIEQEGPNVHTKTVEGKDQLECLLKLLVHVTDKGALDEEFSENDIFYIFGDMDYDSGYFIHAVFNGEPLKKF